MLGIMLPPPRVTDDTDPADVDHTGDSTTPTDGQLVPDYRQLGFRVPAIVVSNLAPRRIEHRGPYEHSSTLKLIESTFGLHSITARDTHALDLGRVLDRHPHRPVPAGAIPTSSQVLGPVSDAAAICSADSVQSVSPAPVRRGKPPAQAPPLSPSGVPSGAGMVEFGRRYRQQKGG
jgi:phospholipase C